MPWRCRSRPEGIGRGDRRTAAEKCRQGLFPETRIASVLVVCPTRAGRSCFSLHRTSRIAMLRGLRGRTFRSHGSYFWSCGRPGIPYALRPFSCSQVREDSP